MLCCLNPHCDQPINPDGMKFCCHCGTPLGLLRNHYRPLKPLGEGGFARIYLAEDIDKLNSHCVIKQLAPNVEGSWALQKAKELFEKEAKRLQDLGEHPQIPTLLGYFEEGNHLYLIEQYIEGKTLLEELEEGGAFREEQVREILLDLLAILQFVHQQQVIHRDIKPENIIRRRDGKLVLIDFGIAKQLTGTSMGKPGTTVGSFGYVPMEQMQGGEAYPASDLYSLGATCFHLLSGVHPWELWKTEGYGWVKGWRKHLKGSVSQGLGQVLDKLLQQDYQRRYQSVVEVVEALRPKPAVSTTIQPSQGLKPNYKRKNPIGRSIVAMVLLGLGGTQQY